jgi:outer membrane protein assembly factor BamB
MPCFRRNIIYLLTLIVLSSCQLAGQGDSGWRISPERINIQTGDDRALQLLDYSAQELHGAKWYVDDPNLADIHEEDGRVVVHAKAAGTVTAIATLRGEKRFREITIWSAGQPLPPGTTGWGMHPIGREIGDIAAVPTPDGTNVFSLEQTASGSTYLRGVREDGIQDWAWLMPERTHDVELVCGDWLGGALISANRGDSYTLYTVGKDGKLRWQHTLPGIRKAHAYNLEHKVNLLSQSSDGLATKVTGLDEITGELKFDLAVPPSHEQLTNVQRAGVKILCGSKSSTSPVRTAASRLFVNMDGFAYVAFTQNERMLTSAACIPGSAIEPGNVSFSREDRLILWQIHADGTYRSTIVQESKDTGQLSEPVTSALPTGAIIPDGLGGVLLSIRRPLNVIGDAGHRSADEFVYRIDEDGKLVYEFPLPSYDGPTQDEMVLGENDRGFATRGSILIAFNVRDGKEIWRWDSHTPGIKVFAALENGGCMIQTPAALVEVDNATDSKEIFKGQAMVDWHGQLFRKHN